jgi:hypothetical protein
LGPDAPRTYAPVNFLVTHTMGPANELVIAVNPTDPRNLIAGAKDYTLGREHPCSAAGDGATYPINVWSGVYWSRDGGKSWNNGLMPGHPADAAQPNHPNRAWPCNSDPVVVFAADGTAYYSGLGIRGPFTPDPLHPCLERNRSVWIMKSPDGGQTWDDFSCVRGTTALPGGTGEVIDKQWVAVSGPRVYVTYMSFNPTVADLRLRRSTDAGATWGPEVTLVEFPTPDNPAQAANGRQFSTPAVGPDGTVYVTWRGFGAQGGIYFTRSTDGGLTFEPPRRVAPITPMPSQMEGGYRTSSYPVLTVSPSPAPAGSLHVAWADARDGDTDVLYARSTDRGTTWSQPRKLNEDGIRDAHQFLPWLAAAGGHLHVAWLDSRAYPNATRLDVILRSSLDAGASWGPELRVNEETIETGDCFHQNGGPFMGDYIGLAASGHAVHPFWPSAHTGRCNGYTATILP